MKSALQNKTVTILTLVMLLIPFGLFVWLVMVDIAPRGERTAQLVAGQMSPFIDRLLPDDRLLGLQRVNGQAFETMVEQPVYFRVTPPLTAFTNLDVEVWFKNHGQPVLELGGLGDVRAQAYTFLPLQNQIIDALTWPHVTDGTVTLWQRVRTHDSVEAFLDDVPDDAVIATYQYDLEGPFRLASYLPSDQTYTLRESLRGHHKYVTYIKDETFMLTVDVEDMNRTTGADEGFVRVYNERGEGVLEARFDDDGNTTENQEVDRKRLTLTQAGLPEGVYTVELSGTSDIFWRTLSTTQRYMVFVNQVYLADEVGYATTESAATFVTNAKHLTLETLHAEAVQNVDVGGQMVELMETHEKVHVDVTASGVVPVSVPVGDVKIVGKGKFAFSQEAFFDPDPLAVDAFTDLDAQGVDYLLTTYTAPRQEGDWLVQRNTFSLASLAQIDGALTFALSATGMEQWQSTIDVHKIVVRFTKDPMTVREVVRAIVDRIPFGL
jgi:hypothetical protein